MKIVSAVCGSLLVAAGAYAATNWVVGLNAGSSGEGQSATIANLTITAVASPAPGQSPVPGQHRRRRRHHRQPEPVPRDHHGGEPPDQHHPGRRVHDQRADDGPDRAARTTHERRHLELRHRDQRQLAHADDRRSTVGASGAANNPLVVTLTNDALMATASPAACANTFFSMPSLTGVTATGGSATSTTSPATDAWTS